MKRFSKFVQESIELDEAFKIGDKVTYQKSKKERGNAVISSISTTKKNHFYLKTEKEGTIMVPGGELELQESIELDEKLKASDDMGDWVKDFQDSDAPQFKGKSQKKRQQMAIAAKLSAERNEEVEELDEISKDMMGRYFDKADASHKKARKALDKANQARYGRQATKDKHRSTINKRIKGIGSVLKRDFARTTGQDYITKPSRMDAIMRGDKGHSMTTKRSDQLHKNYKEEVELDQETQYEIVESYLLENNIDVDSLTEQELNELIGKAIGGAFKLGAKAVVGASRLAKKAVINKQGNIRGTQAARQDAAGNRAEKEAKRREAEYNRRKRIQDAEKRARDLDDKIRKMKN